MIEIRSYRRVFDLERRIYSIDRVRLNPGGVPVRGLMYFLALVALALVTADLPLIGALARQLPWYLRAIALPGAGATVLGAIRLEGRTFHLAARALMRYRLGPRRLAGMRRCGRLGGVWRPGEILLLPDGSDSRLRRLRYTGPGAVLVLVEHDRRGRAIERGSLGTARRGLGPTLRLSQSGGARQLDRGQVIALASGARLLVTAGASGSD
ncbi:MAG: hypothetical protein JWN10_2575 [Solirubrobacterales bacterium]|nr:hypothetical protein [Solirubrobacterales bacterium]